MRQLLCSALLLLPIAARAQAPSPTDAILTTKAELQQHKAALLKTAAADKNGFAMETLRRDDGHFVLLVGRVKTGEAEQHDLWADEIVCTEGDMIVVVGGEMQGKYAGVAPGESRGAGVASGKEYPLHPGDIAMIPAGVPHWVKLAGTTPAFYTVYKVK